MCSAHLALFVLTRDHLLLGKITNPNGSPNQFVRDEMRGFGQTVSLLIIPPGAVEATSMGDTAL